MTEAQANKILSKEKKRLDKLFKTKFNKVRKKIMRIKLLSKEDKKVLLYDLSKVNGDLMYMLEADKDPWNKVEDYFDTVNAYFRSETDCYDYGTIILAYMPGKMEGLMLAILDQHKIIEQKERLKELIGMK